MEGEEVVQEAEPEKESVDPWAEAAEEFESSEVEEPKEEKAEESHLEPKAEDVPEYLKRLQLTKIPHKYKPLAEEWGKQIAAEYEEKLKSVTADQEELGQTKATVKKLVEIFQDSAKNREKFDEYVQKYGPMIGVVPSSIPQKQEAKQEKQSTPSIADIGNKYAEALISTDDPKQFISILNQQNAEIANAVEQGLMGKVGQLLKVYHDKLIAPDKETLQEFKTKLKYEAEMAEYNTRKSSWEKASDSLKSEYDDFEKYVPKISEMIKAEEHLSAARDKLNEKPEEVEGRKKFIRDLYLALSRQDHIENAKKPRLGGLPPSQKHIPTTKKGGGNWGDAWEQTKHLYE